MACTNGRSYHIKEGDSLYAIAEHVLGDGDRWPEIRKADGCHFTETEANNLEAGQEICLPPNEQPASGGGNGAGNAFTNRVFELTNNERRHAGLSPLRLNAQLTAAAQAHSEDMARHKEMTHTGSNGSTAAQRMERAGYHPWRHVAENVAHGQDTPEDVIASWMRSEKHRANLLSDEIADIGIGYANAYWTQDFGRLH